MSWIIILFLLLNIMTGHALDCFECLTIIDGECKTPDKSKTVINTCDVRKQKMFNRTGINLKTVVNSCMRLAMTIQEEKHILRNCGYNLDCEGLMEGKPLTNIQTGGIIDDCQACYSDLCNSGILKIAGFWLTLASLAIKFFM